MSQGAGVLDPTRSPGPQCAPRVSHPAPSRGRLSLSGLVGFCYERSPLSAEIQAARAGQRQVPAEVPSCTDVGNAWTL